MSRGKVGFQEQEESEKKSVSLTLETQKNQRITLLRCPASQMKDDRQAKFMMKVIMTLQLEEKVKVYHQF